jgi:Undecaprenyl-phosphate glucose phosphotransferase
MVDIRTRSIERAQDGESTRRGPFRPQRLVSVRQRQDRRLAAHRFRALDSILLFGLAVVLGQQMFSSSMLEAPLGDAIPVAAGVWSMWSLMRAAGLYRFSRNERLLVHLGRLWAVGIASAGVASLLYLLVPDPTTSIGDISRLIAICVAAMSMLHIVWWAVVARWRSLGLLTPNVVIVGATSHAEELIVTALDRRDINVLGLFDDRAERSPAAMLGVPVLGTTGSMAGHRVMPYVDLVVVTIDQSAVGRVRQIMERLSRLPNTVTLLFDDPVTGRRAAAIDQIADAPLAPLHPATTAERKTFAKRVQDLVIGVPALILFAPFMLVIAVAVRLGSRGPVFFRQDREGFNNEVISVWKFRTMLHAVADPRCEQQVRPNDDRVTRVGRVLRATSLDELPQLFNVIAGEMSLVGPRPHAIGMKTGDVESAKLVAEYAHRHRIKPGMTGWAAVNGSRGPLHEADDVSRRVELDVGYIERQSFWFDMSILVRTVPSMLGDRHSVR